MSYVTKHDIRDAVLFTVCLAIGLFADDLGAGPTAPAAVPSDKPAHQAVQAVPLAGKISEGPDEDLRITAALVEQGYFCLDVPLSFALQDALHTSCERHSVPYHLALGLIEVESRFDTEAVNKKSGCYGLTQINPRFFQSGLSPAENIEAGIGHLGALLERYGDTAAALTAYHDGHDTGRRGYANAVLTAAERWERTWSQ